MPSSWRKNTVLVASLLVAAFAFMGVFTAPRPSHTQSAVIAYRDAHPGEAVPVIVQSDVASDPAELVRAAGGEVRTALGIIHAVAADVPSDRIDDLASARGVTWVSLDGGVSSAGGGKNNPVADGATAASVYPQEVHADKAWAQGNYGQGVGVAVLDTGVVNSDDFNGSGSNRLVVNTGKNSPNNDGYGHGSHVAGLIAGDGTNSGGNYVGIAPQANIINVKVGGDDGSATVSDVINGLQFIVDNGVAYNIRVVNLSLRSDTAQSYTTDPLDAAVELVTFRGILVVVAVGNTGTVSDAVSYAPANDPFVLSVGALDDKTTADYRDDAIPLWSSRGVTQDGFAKPEVYVPGRRLISVLSPNSVLTTQFPANVVGSNYFALSGTSMAAGVASGTAALVFQAHPDWTPGQVHLALAETAAHLPGDSSAKVALADRAINLKSPPVDTTLNIKPNYLLLQAAGIADPQSISWGSVSWGSISWGSISWGSVSWGSVSWGSISWGSAQDQ